MADDMCFRPKCPYESTYPNGGCIYHGYCNAPGDDCESLAVPPSLYCAEHRRRCTVPYCDASPIPESSRCPVHTLPAEQTCRARGCYERVVSGTTRCATHPRQSFGRPPEHIACTAPNCGQPHLALGLCRKHYTASRRGRHPLL